MTNSEASFPDSHIIASVLAGTRDDFRHLVTRYQDLVFSMLMRQIGDRSVAEELAQETFCRAYQHLKSFRAESAFGTWITRIALNQASSYFSSRKFKQAKKTESFDIQTHDMSSGETRNPHERKEIFLAFRAALGEITPKLRDVLVLCALEGKSYEETATILEIPVGTVRSRLNAARLQIKKLVPTTFFEA